jgi:mono/diheme cytochrome c family protein
MLERRLPLTIALVLALAASAGATVEMQNDAKRLGLKVQNCLYCHASPHAVEKMKAKAKQLAMADGNCLACHGANIPAGLNDRGDWLVAEKDRRKAKACDMAWLKEYKEPAPAATKPAPARKP